MTDLTKITTPFGLLDIETQRRLKEHGGPYEIVGESGWEHYRGTPLFTGRNTYRVKPTPQITTHKETRWAVFEVSGLSLYRSKTLGKGGVRGVLNTTYCDDKPIRAVWEADKR